MPNRSQLGQLGRETLALLDRGGYAAPNGTTVDLAEAMRYAKDHTIHYTPEMFGEVFRRRDEILATVPRFSTTFEVVNHTTLAAARQLCDREPRIDVLCLNFASAKHPGGGFLGGAREQEESLARASGLYPCIARMQGMYQANKQWGSCLYTDHMIWSPRVPVFRDDEGNLLDQPYAVSFLTAPAVNAGAVKEHERALIEPTMVARMEKVLSVAVVQRHHTLVLGAWGCGVFKNDPTRVAQAFHRYLIEGATFCGAFKHVVFAVTDWSAERRFIGPFEATFARLLASGR